MNTKKLVSTFLAIALAVSFAGCKSKEDKKPAELESSEESSSLSDGISINNATESEIVEHNNTIDPNDIVLVQFDKPKTEDLIAIFNTSAGKIYVLLYPEYAPLAVENFKYHSENGFYNGSEFFKVIENFYIQSGAPFGTPDKSTYLDDNNNPIPFETETNLNLWNFRGALVMRNKGGNHPDTNTSEFFLVQSYEIEEELFAKMKDTGFPDKVIEKYREIGGIPGYDGRYTVFGQVYSGMEVVDKIASTSVDKLYTPKETIWINSIDIMSFDSDNPIPSEESSLPSGNSSSVESTIDSSDNP